MNPVWRPCVLCAARVEVPAIGCDLLVPMCGVCQRDVPNLVALLQRAEYETQPNGVCGGIHETDDWRERLKTLVGRLKAARASKPDR